MKEIRQCDTEVSWQRQGLPEVPKIPATVLPANLQIIVTELGEKKIKQSKLTRQNRDICHILPGQIPPQHLGIPSEAEWLLSQLLWPQEPPEPWRWQQREHRNKLTKQNLQDAVQYVEGKQITECIMSNLVNIIVFKSYKKKNYEYAYI